MTPILSPSSSQVGAPKNADRVQAAYRIDVGRWRGPIDFAVRDDLRRPEMEGLGRERVSAEVTEQVLSRAIDDTEPTLSPNGYELQVLIALIHAKPAAIRDFPAGISTGEFTEETRVVGVSV